MAVMTENEQTIAELNEAYEHTRDKLTAERAANARLRAELERLLRDQGSALQSAMLRIERQEAELAKPEDARLRDVIEALDRRAVMLESPGDRVRWILRELDEWVRHYRSMWEARLDRFAAALERKQRRRS